MFAETELSFEQDGDIHNDFSVLPQSFKHWHQIDLSESKSSNINQLEKVSNKY